MSVEIDIVYRGALRCEATHGPSKHTVFTDAPVDNGGKGASYSPTDLVAAAAGTCMLTIMGLVAQRNGLDLNGTRVHVVKEMVADPVRRIGSLTITIALPADRPLDPDVRSKLERAAHTCPVTQSLHPDVKVHVKFQ
jgi:putative redox protein